MNTKCKAAQLLNRTVRWFERQTDRRLRRIALDGGRKYIKKKNELEEDGIEICVTAAYTPEENGGAERMNRTINNAVRTMLLYLDALANLWVDCF